MNVLNGNSKDSTNRLNKNITLVQCIIAIQILKGRKKRGIYIQEEFKEKEKR